ncbi:hypothetical protein GCM10023194_76440 [Planotetraspora phitsanulokensis]|uniref:Uncharacterized protein n=1 Tax=Planotetraspora phitsanulokensis TaxID=575192 RepID=A0A8J3TZ65_9ACTN|nr:hypothetical protein [Planotetraspora phitsanulokensis]GII35458.1 hypothetical protein Pph01_04610 [Planotetraspora phitsanulokensis]
MSLNQWRSDDADHALEVSVRNDGTTKVRFQDVQLVTASFATLAPERVDTTLGKTPRTDLRIPYGQARCDPARIPPVKPATVIAHIQVGGGPLEKVTFVVPHPDPTLTGLVNAECGAFILRESADVTFGDSWTHTGKVLTGVVLVTRKNGDEPVTVDDLGGTTHFNVRPVSGRRHPVVVLEPGVRSLEIPVEVTPARCDAHAFAEAKKAYLFPVWGSVGAGQTYWLIATPSDQTKATMLSYAEDACGIPSG